MAKPNIDITFLYEDNAFKFGKSGGKYFIAFSPYPSGIKSKAKWIGISPVNEVVARALSCYFTQMAEQYESNNKKASNG